MIFDRFLSIPEAVIIARISRGWASLEKFIDDTEKNANLFLLLLKHRHLSVFEFPKYTLISPLEENSPFQKLYNQLKVLKEEILSDTPFYRPDLICNILQGLIKNKKGSKNLERVAYIHLSLRQIIELAEVSKKYSLEIIQFFPQEEKEILNTIIAYIYEPENTTLEKKLRDLFSEIYETRKNLIKEKFIVKIKEKAIKVLDDGIGKIALIDKKTQRNFRITNYFLFYVKAPLFVVRQWMRHRAGVFLEKSARYTKIKNPEYYLPPEFQNKKEIKNLLENLFSVYGELLKSYPSEISRIVLPEARYTEFFWLVPEWSLRNFLKLRTDIHAQREIRKYALIIQKIFTSE